MDGFGRRGVSADNREDFFVRANIRRARRVRPVSPEGGKNAAVVILDADRLADAQPVFVVEGETQALIEDPKVRTAPLRPKNGRLAANALVQEAIVVP